MSQSPNKTRLNIPELNYLQQKIDQSGVMNRIDHSNNNNEINKSKYYDALDTRTNSKKKDV